MHTYLPAIPILQQRVHRVDLLQLGLLVRELGGRGGRCGGEETPVHPLAYGVLELAFRAQRVPGPAREGAQVVLVCCLRGRVSVGCFA